MRRNRARAARLARAALLASAALLAAGAAAEARLVQSKKAAEQVERGGRRVQPGARHPGCIGTVVPAADLPLGAPLVLAPACLGLPEIEQATRAAAYWRFFLPDGAGVWRAPRLADRPARPRRFRVERRRDHIPPPPSP